MTLAFLLTATLLVATVLLHYEGLRGLSRLFERASPSPRRLMLLVIAGVFVLHFIEIAMYGGGYWLGIDMLGLGRFSSSLPITQKLFFYFSAETFSSLGLGDVVVLGPLRMMASAEVLNGLILIGWSASFTYLAMQRLWETHKPPTANEAAPSFSSSAAAPPADTASVSSSRSETASSLPHREAKAR
jgi:hypothetical protein